MVFDIDHTEPCRADGCGASGRPSISPEAWLMNYLCAFCRAGRYVKLGSTGQPGEDRHPFPVFSNTPEPYWRQPGNVAYEPCVNPRFPPRMAITTPHPKRKPLGPFDFKGPIGLEPTTSWSAWESAPDSRESLENANRSHCTRTESHCKPLHWRAKNLMDSQYSCAGDSVFMIPRPRRSVAHPPHEGGRVRVGGCSGRGGWVSGAGGYAPWARGGASRGSLPQVLVGQHFGSLEAQLGSLDYGQASSNHSATALRWHQVHAASQQSKTAFSAH